MFSSPLKYILNLVFLLSLVARKRCIQLGRDSICFERADLFFLAKTLGMSLEIKWKTVPVACKYCTKCESTSSFWIMYYLSYIKLLIERRVLSLPKTKVRNLVGRENAVVKWNFFNAFSLTHIFEDSVVVLKWVSVILRSEGGLFKISLQSLNILTGHSKCVREDWQKHCSSFLVNKRLSQR